ncbi:MAG: hypothetical protein EBS86_11100, partial [Crocinitomicaceae bacterium]|nr:hypothetical protein [Crocinitomicaceae bacterium]
YDLNLSTQQMYVARDPYGIRPLYMFADNINKTSGRNTRGETTPINKPIACSRVKLILIF